MGEPTGCAPDRFVATGRPTWGVRHGSSLSSRPAWLVPRRFPSVARPTEDIPVVRYMGRPTKGKITPTTGIPHYKLFLPLGPREASHVTNLRRDRGHRLTINARLESPRTRLSGAPLLALRIAAMMMLHRSAPQPNPAVQLIFPPCL